MHIKLFPEPLGQLLGPVPDLTLVKTTNVHGAPTLQINQ